MWQTKLSVKNNFIFDYTHMLGEKRLSIKDLETFSSQMLKAAARVQQLYFKGIVPSHLSKTGQPEPVYFLRQGFLKPGNPNTDETMLALEAYSDRVKEQVDVVIFLGIGGSYLGGRMLFDIVAGPYWNSLPRAKRRGRPRIYFSGNNADPQALLQLQRQLEYLASRKAKKATKAGKTKTGGKAPLKVELVPISKSGTTMELMSAFSYFYAKLAASDRCQVTVTAVTGMNQEESALYRLAQEHHWPVFAIPEGIGGRFSVLSAPGLIVGAALGLNLRKLLLGARQMTDTCLKASADDNPALINAALKYLSAQKLGMNIEIFMGYGDRLKSLGEWYVQLLAESLGKRRDRQGREINYGRTPVAAVGTTDMHAQTQLHQDGPRDKVVQFLEIQQGMDLLLPKVFAGDSSCTNLAGISLRELQALALKANEQALAGDGRPSARYILPKLDEQSLGQLLMFLMLSIAYEGELADVDAYDQPGVEAYKKIMKQELPFLAARHTK